jgi:hypothetical protein
MLTKQSLDVARFRFWLFRDKVLTQVLGKTHLQSTFTHIFRENLWGDSESASGSGSGHTATESIRVELPKIFDVYGIKSVLDAPCGDFVWMDKINLNVDKYIGVDIVPELIESNTKKYASETISFLCADIATETLPTADLIICRDCFIHLPTRMIHSALANFVASGARYIFITNDLSAKSYHDIPLGSFRKINFMEPPFSFPQPDFVITENHSGQRQLCLWTLNTIKETLNLHSGVFGKV